MKLTQFLKENNISIYKLSQLGGYNAAQYSGATKRKATGKGNMPIDELSEYCKGLSTYLNKPIKPEDFDYEVREVVMK